MNRRDFLELLATATACGLSMGSAFGASRAASAPGRAAAALYDVPAFGNVHLLHITDTHAQLLPTYFREPDVNLGIGAARGRPPHLVGGALLRHFGIPAHTREAHALTELDFVPLAQRYGKAGGFAHLATLVKRLKADRPGAVLVDGGDSWQGSATALWTQGRDMIEVQKALGVEVMTGHWEFTYGAERLRQAVEHELDGSIEFVAQNVRTADFGDPVFKPYTLRTQNGVPYAIVGQAFPYTPIANPRYFVPDWTFGIQEETLAVTVAQARAAGAQAVVLLSHNGMDVDLKLASRVRGIDVILGGHTHDAVPRPVIVDNAGGRTVVTNAGCNGKFLGVLDLDVRGSAVDWRYRLLPVFANLLPADPAMAALVDRVRAPFAPRLSARLARTEGLLYRRGNFNGTFDQLILDALLAEKDAEIALSPGFRWGPTLLPGDTITYERLLDETAITYPYTTVTAMTGATLKTILEDVADNLFNPDPYYQQGGDMVRVGGLAYRCTPGEAIGRRIDDMRLHGHPVEADRTYKVAGWAPVSEESRAAATEPIWDVVARYLGRHPRLEPRVVNLPALAGVAGNPGIREAGRGRSS